jgi:hypothetical protein
MRTRLYSRPFEVTMSDMYLYKRALGIDRPCGMTSTHTKAFVDRSAKRIK